MATRPPQDPSAGSNPAPAFPIVRRGFDPEAVRDHLRQVAQELARLRHEHDRLARDLQEAREAARHVAPEDLDEATVVAKLGEEAARVLATAHQAAGQIRSRAEETSARLLREAEEDASRQRGDAEVEAARRRRETDEQCEAELEAAKSEGREMVAEARAIRERVFDDLTRRRELARQQIETLHFGRERILESFRGAQRDLASILTELEDQLPDDADDELPPLDLPDTGPVPTTSNAPTTSASPASPPPPTPLVIGEMDVPAAIVARHVEPQRERSVAAEPDVPAEAESEPEEEMAAEAESGADAEVAAEPDSEPPPEGGPGPVAEADSQPEPDVADATTAKLPVVSTPSAAQPAAPTPTASSPAVSPPSVDDLFARLRAAGTATVAREVLDVGDARASPRDNASPNGTHESAAEEAVGRRNALLAPLRTRLSRQLKRVIADEQNDVLDQLRQRNASTATDDVLGTPDAHAGRYREAAEDQLWSAAEAGAHAMSDVEGEELHAALEARSVLERCLDTVTSELVVPLRARLTENLEASGDDPTEAATLLRSTYREWKGRLDELSDDLTRTAYGRAAYAVIATGTPVCWVVDPSGPPCPDAEDNALAGAVAAGEPFPTGHRYAPAYRGCRCLLVAAPR